MQSELAVTPPSTFSAASERSASATMASTTSALWWQMASSAARARCALVLNRDRPTIAPRASDLQYGANRPENAGTKAMPPVSSTSAARASVSAASSMMPSWSRSHWMADPVTAIDPSSAYTAGSSPKR